MFAGEKGLSHLSEEAKRLAPPSAEKECALAGSIKNWWKSEGRTGGKRYRGVSETWDVDGSKRDEPGLN